MNETLNWANDCILATGHSILKPVEAVVTTPWSSVSRFQTAVGYFYLKQMPPALSLEPNIIQMLYEKRHGLVPEIIGTNEQLHCFLMKDSGIPLREYFKTQFELKILSQGIKNYTSLQVASLELINHLLGFGVPDWRMKKFLGHYEELLNQEALLLEDGLTKDELNILKSLTTTVSMLCKDLSSYNVPETLDHCDFHDNNILIDIRTQKITIIDLGETVITHPFFSLLTCISKATYSYHLSDNENAELQQASFENWLGFESKEKLIEIYHVAKKLYPIYTALAYYRLKQSADTTTFNSFPRRFGRIAGPLKEFISVQI